MKRIIENCTVAAMVYDRHDARKYEDGGCAGVRNSGDEPIEKCKQCKLFYLQED